MSEKKTSDYFPSHCDKCGQAKWLSRYCQDLDEKVQELREALEHYESAHYDIYGIPCAHDTTATEALARFGE